MGILSNLFGGSNISVRLVGDDGRAANYSTASGSTLGDFLGQYYPGYSPDRFVVKVVRAGIKNEVDASYVLQNGDTVSACIPKNVAGA